MKRGGAAAATAGTPAPGKTTTTEEQARAIMCAARRAVEEANRARGGGAGALSLKKSLEWFLERRSPQEQGDVDGRRRDPAPPRGLLQPVEMAGRCISAQLGPVALALLLSRRAYQTILLFVVQPLL